MLKYIVKKTCRNTCKSIFEVIESIFIWSIFTVPFSVGVALCVYAGLYYLSVLQNDVMLKITTTSFILAEICITKHMIKKEK
jgi:hypothetical protein